MTDKTDNSPGAAAGIPQPNPPKGGPNKDDDSPNPADLAPGFGGTSATRPMTTEEDDSDSDREE
jgi:hypothetical protein